MTDPALQELVDAAAAYESMMVPALFGPWAAPVAEAAGIRPGERVLDVACGTGVLAREVSNRVGPTGRVAGLDRNPGMLEVARRIAPAVEWHQGSAESLPFPDAAFDAVVCQFGLMLFDDPRRALREALRVLAPGGRLAFAVWDALANIPAYRAEAALLEMLAGEAAAEALHIPFALGEPARLAALCAAAGVEEPEFVTRHGTARFPTARAMVEADLRGWLPAVGVVLPEATVQRILEAAEEVLAPYVTTDGAAAFRVSAHILTVTRT